MNNLVRFGPFSVDLAARHLYCNGAKIAIQGQPFHILEVLLRNPEAIVSRHSLAAEIWPTGTFVDFEHSLNTAVKKLRKALGDNPDQPIYIETVPRYGYRFVGKIEDAVSPAPIAVPKPAAKVPPATAPVEHVPPIRHFWQPFTKLDIVALAAAFIVLVLAASWRQPEWYRAGASAKPITSVAVLPFQNLTGDSNEDYLADGMTDAVIANVSQFQNLSVVSRGSVAAYKGTRTPINEITRELKVDAVVTGSLTESDGTFGLAAQLVRAGSDSPLWAAKYQGKLGNLMRVQSDLSAAIGHQVHAVLPVASARSAKNSSGDSQGYENYLRGRYFLNKRGEEDLRKAETYFTQSIAEDANLAPAYAGLADCYTLEVMYGILSRTSGTEKAQSTARHALELDDNLAEAHTALGGVDASYLWDWKSAEREFQRAIQMNPSDAAAHHWYAVFVLAPLGRLDEALVEMQSAHELDPLSAIMETDLGFVYYLRGQYAEASKAYDQALEINPDFVPAHFRRCQLDVQLGKLDDAVYETVANARLTGKMSPTLEEALRRAQTAYRSSGYPGFVQEMLKYEHERTPAAAHDSSEAAEHLVLGQRDLALTEFAAAADARDPGMLYVAVDPSLKSVRSDPRFKDVLRRMGLFSE